MVDLKANSREWQNTYIYIQYPNIFYLIAFSTCLDVKIPIKTICKYNKLLIWPGTIKASRITCVRRYPQPWVLFLFTPLGLGYPGIPGFIKMCNYQKNLWHLLTCVNLFLACPVESCPCSFHPLSPSLPCPQDPGAVVVRPKTFL